MTSEALAELEKAPDGAQAITHDAVAPLTRRRAARARRLATTRSQREAKDALFALRGERRPPIARRSTITLVAWTTADLVGRMSAGGHSSEKILIAIGPRRRRASASCCSPTRRSR